MHLKCLYTNSSSMQNKQGELEALAMASLAQVRFDGKSPGTGVL